MPVRSKSLLIVDKIKEIEQLKKENEELKKLNDKIIKIYNIIKEYEKIKISLNDKGLVNKGLINIIDNEIKKCNEQFKKEIEELNKQP
jgi:protein subunit release factor A